MVHALLTDYTCYCPLHPALAELFAFIDSHNLMELPPGKIVLDGERLFLNVDDVQLMSRESQCLEVHRRYLDVHIPVNGIEECGWSPFSALKVESEAPFDIERDFALYRQPAETYFTVRPGEFYLMFPTDAHAPVIGTGRMRKLVGKIRLDK